MARFAAKTYYLFDGHPKQDNLVGVYRGLASAKAAGDEGYGHKERWTKSTFRRSHDDNVLWLTEYYGGSGNRYTICDYLPPGVVVPEGTDGRVRRR